MLIGFVDGGTHQLNRCVMRMLAQDVYGIAVILPPEQDLTTALRSFDGAAIVSLDQGPVGSKSTVLKVNYRSGMREAIQHLAALGHRKISLLDRPGQSHFSQEMFAAFHIGMTELGLSYDSDSVLRADFTEEAGAGALCERLSVQPRPTAFIAADGPTALEAISLARDLGLRVPQDLSIVSFGSMHGDSHESATLTSIELSPTDIAMAARNALCIHSETKVGPSLNSAQMSTRLVVRQSTDFAITPSDGAPGRGPAL